MKDRRLMELIVSIPGFRGTYDIRVWVAKDYKEQVKKPYIDFIQERMRFTKYLVRPRFEVELLTSFDVARLVLGMKDVNAVEVKDRLDGNGVVLYKNWP